MKKTGMATGRKILLAVGVLLAAAVLFCLGYWLRYRQGVIQPDSFTAPGAARRVLVASQGSDYKQALVAKLAARLQQDSTSVQVIDVTALPTVNEAEYDAIVLVCSIEFYAAPKDVAAFIAAASRPERIVLVTTSGQGDMGPQECRIDAITGASRPADLDAKVAAIIARLPGA